MPLKESSEFLRVVELLCKDSSATFDDIFELVQFFLLGKNTGSIDSFKQLFLRRGLMINDHQLKSLFRTPYCPKSI